MIAQHDFISMHMRLAAIFRTVKKLTLTPDVASQQTIIKALNCTALSCKAILA